MFEKDYKQTFEFGFFFNGEPSQQHKIKLHFPLSSIKIQTLLIPKRLKFQFNREQFPQLNTLPSFSGLKIRKLFMQNNQIPQIHIISFSYYNKVFFSPAAFDNRHSLSVSLRPRDLLCEYCPPAIIYEFCKILHPYAIATRG